MISTNQFEKLATIALLGLLFLTSCPPAQEEEADFDSAALYMQSWELLRFEIEGKTEAASAPSSLNFGQDSQLGGNSGCNQFGGDHKTMGNQLIIGPMMMTKRYCDEVALQEGAIIRVLGDTVTMKMEGDELHLSNEGGVLIYGPGPADISQNEEPDNSGSLDHAILASNEWLLSHYETTGELQNAKATAYLAFTELGNISGSSGCNTLGASYDLVGQHIVTREMLITEAFCEGYAAQELAIISVLGDTAELAISEGKLHIRNQQGTLIYSPAPEDGNAVVAATSTTVAKGAAPEIGGLFVYMADAAGFQPCGSEESYPVSMEKGYLACEKAYSAMEKYGEPAYLVVKGYTAPNPEPEGKRTVFIIEELVRSTPDNVCP